MAQGGGEDVFSVEDARVVHEEGSDGFEVALRQVGKVDFRFVFERVGGVVLAEEVEDEGEGVDLGIAGFSTVNSSGCLLNLHRIEKSTTKIV